MRFPEPNYERGRSDQILLTFRGSDATVPTFRGRRPTFDFPKVGELSEHLGQYAKATPASCLYPMQRGECCVSGQADPD